MGRRNIYLHDKHKNQHGGKYISPMDLMPDAAGLKKSNVDSCFVHFSQLFADFPNKKSDLQVVFFFWVLDPPL